MFMLKEESFHVIVFSISYNEIKIRIKKKVKERKYV